MELKLDIYKDRLCRNLDKTVTAQDFELSTGICEDVLDFVNIDMFSGGLSALSDETKQELIVEIVKNGYPFFVQFVQEIFELTEEETKHIKVADIAKVVIDIVKYAFTQLASSLGGTTKN